MSQPEPVIVEVVETDANHTGSRFNSKKPITSPTARFMRGHAAHWIAFGFGSGLSPIMPGTVGTLFAWLSFHVINRWLPDLSWGLTLVIGFLIGVWACSKTSQHMGVDDHGSMVWDEIIAFWLVLWVLTPSSFGTEIWAFIWFRVFDMLKPPPIGYFDKNLKGAGWRGMKSGFGVMFDDILAAFYTLLIFAFWRSH